MAEYLMNLSVLDDMGKELYMRDLIKKVTLIVNVDCKVGGESNNECPELEALYLRHKDKGFEILAFPCDQFQLGSKARCTAADVKVDLVKRYGISFPILGKVNVNGDHAHPLFIFLQKRLSGFATDMIKWDFTKFLLVDGEPRKRYSPTTSPHSLEAEIAQALATHSVLIGDEGTNLSSSSISQDSVKPWQQDIDASQQKGYLAMQPQIREQQQQQYQQPPQQFGLGDQGITQPTPTQTAYPYQQGYDVDRTTTPSTGARVESAMESTKATLSEKYEQAKNTLSNVGERVGQATGLSSSAKSQEPLLIRVNNKDQGYDFGSGMGMQQQDTLSRRNIQPESWTSSDRGFVSQPGNDNVDLSYGGDNSRWREGDEDRFGDINRDRDINVMPQFQQGYDMAGDNQQSDFFGGRGLSQREGDDSLLQDRGIVDRGIVGRRQDDVERGDDKLYGYDDDSNKQQQQQWQPQQQRDIGRDDNTNLQGYDFGTRSTQYGQRDASLTPMQQLHREGLGQQQQQQQFGGSGLDEQRIQQSIDRTPHNMHDIIKELEHADNSGLGSGIVHGARDERLASQEPEFVQDSNVDSMDKFNDNWNAQSQWPQQQQQPFSQQQQLPQWQQQQSHQPFMQQQSQQPFMQQQPQQPFMQQQQPYMQQGGQVPHSQVKVSDLVKEFESGAHLNDKQM